MKYTQEQADKLFPHIEFGGCIEPIADHTNKLCHTGGGGAPTVNTGKQNKIVFRTDEARQRFGEK